MTFTGTQAGQKRDMSRRDRDAGTGTCPGGGLPPFRGVTPGCPAAVPSPMSGLAEPTARVRPQGAEARQSDKPLCVICEVEPRFGTLTRCKPCIKRQAEQDLAALDAARTRAAAAAAAKAAEQGHIKRCRTCATTKPLADFAKHKQSRDGHRRQCRDCASQGKVKRQASDRRVRNSPERRAVNRVSVKSWKVRNPEAYRASQVLNRAIRKGIIARPTRCQVDGCDFRGKTQAHHPDYSLPLIAAYCCPKHHRRLHAGQKLKLIDGLPQALVAVPEAA